MVLWFKPINKGGVPMEHDAAAHLRYFYLNSKDFRPPFPKKKRQSTSWYEVLCRLSRHYSVPLTADLLTKRSRIRSIAGAFFSAQGSHTVAFAPFGTFCPNATLPPCAAAICSTT